MGMGIIKMRWNVGKKERNNRINGLAEETGIKTFTEGI